MFGKPLAPFECGFDSFVSGWIFGVDVDAPMICVKELEQNFMLFDVRSVERRREVRHCFFPAMFDELIANLRLATWQHEHRSI